MENHTQIDMSREYLHVNNTIKEMVLKHVRQKQHLPYRVRNMKENKSAPATQKKKQYTTIYTLF